ncbi:MAG: T9SS type A sorting domain-containing protein [Flavobacteriales bacterium]
MRYLQEAGLVLAIMAMGTNPVVCRAQFAPPKWIHEQLLKSCASMAAEDLDQDGFVDIVALGDRVILYRGVDNQTNFDEQVLFDEAIPYEFDAVHLLDVDDDGSTDICFSASYTVFSGALLWSRNLGDGAFGPLEAFPQSASWVNVQEFTPMDIDLDGDMDALLLLTPSNLVQMENQGAGVWSPPTQVASLDYDSELIAFDFDNDGRMDILASAIVGATMGVRVLQNNGLGSFNLTTNYAISACNPFGALAADVDLDGNDDIIDRTSCNGALEWRRSLGNGNFDPPLVLMAFSDMLYDLAQLDVNNDGLDDLVSLEYESVEVALAEGNGVYGPVGQFVVPLLPTTSPSYTAMLFSNLDADQTAELLVVDGGVITYLDLPGDAITQFIKHLNPVVTPEDPFFHVSDLNNDGNPDVLRISGAFGALVLHEGLANQEFAKERVLLTDVGEIDIIDMDGDGDEDLVITNDSLEIHTNQGGFVFAETYAASMSNVYSLRCHDLDDDGDVDILYSLGGGGLHLRRYRNNGNNTFTSLPTTPALQFGNTPRVVGFMDVDQDGDEDILGLWDYYSLEWVRNDGDMNFGARSILGSGAWVWTVEILDIDMDGDLDLYGTGSSDPGFWIEHLTGSDFEPAVVLIDNTYGNCAPRIMDVDRDGDPDVVLPLPTAGGVMRLNDGAGNFAAAEPLTSAELFAMPYQGSIPHVEPYDMDADGDMDFAYYTAIGGSDTYYGIAWSENFAADPYHLSGTIFADMDGDGALGLGEVGLPGASVSADPSGNIALGGATGTYLLYSNAGSQSVSATAPNDMWSLSSMPATYTVSPSDLQPDWPGLDFGFTPTIDTSLVHPELVLASAPCADATSMWISLMNAGTRIEHGTIGLTLDDLFEFIGSSPVPSSIIGNTLAWTFDTLSFGATQVIHLEVIMPPSQAMGTEYSNIVLVTTLDDQGDPAGTFTTELGGIVTCSFDPNDKMVTPIGYGAFGAVPLGTDHVDYTVRFQNTGNATAVNVTVRDQIDPAFQIASLRMLGYSHEPTAINIEPGNELVVRFDNIQLPDSGTSSTDSQGFFKFRIDLLSGLPHMTQATNTAEIYFDLNEEVETNTTLTTLVDCSLWEPTVTVLAWNLFQATEGDAYQWYLSGEPLVGENEQVLLTGVAGTYTVSVTSVFGCDNVSAPLTTVTVPEHDQAIPPFVLYPNPTSDDTWLYIVRCPNDGTMVEIHDVYGRLVRQIGVAAGAAPMLLGRDGLAAGTYWVTVREPGYDLRGAQMIIY